MELILVRHAEPAANPSPPREGFREATADATTSTNGTSNGSDDVSDPPLSALGNQQAAAVARWLRGVEVDYVLSSPARRARATAVPLAEQLGAEVSVDPRIRDAGVVGARYRALEADRATDPAAYRARMQAYRHSPQLGEIAGRVNEAFDEWCGRAAGGRIVAFCHGSVVNVYAARVLGLAQPAFLTPAYASGHRFRISRTGVRSVSSLNETAYLPAFG